VRCILPEGYWNVNNARESYQRECGWQASRHRGQRSAAIAFLWQLSSTRSLPFSSYDPGLAHRPGSARAFRHTLPFVHAKIIRSRNHREKPENRGILNIREVLKMYRCTFPVDVV
jgi:hypothetical protein